jgi:hypothetical protein
MRDIGHGVYSTVLSATDEKDSNREVAIKVVVSDCKQTARVPPFLSAQHVALTPALL